MADQDYHVPQGPNVGGLEQRMMYLVHQKTFKEYFSEVAYSKILDEHSARVGTAPSTIGFPLGTEETQRRLKVLIEAIGAAGWQADPLREFFKREMKIADAVWMATEEVEKAGIFVPYYHVRDVAAVDRLFSEGFVDDSVGWGTHPLHHLFSAAKKDYLGAEHLQRMRTIEMAKKAHVIRPISMKLAAGGNVVLSTKGNKYCCLNRACSYNGDVDYYCSITEWGDCSLASDVCQ